MPVKYLDLLEDLLPNVLVVTVSIPTFRERRHPEVRAKVRHHREGIAYNSNVKHVFK